MEMQIGIQKKPSIFRVMSGAMVVAGTAIGAGMLGIPLLTVKAGFWPACFITFATWAFMLFTGLLFLEATLWMPPGSNLLSMTERFFGKKGRWFAGSLFIFLYYCLLIAYFAGGAPILMVPIEHWIGFPIRGSVGFAIYGLIFGSIVALGAKWISRVNLILTVAMILSFIFLIGVGSQAIDSEKLMRANWGISLIAAPLLFSAFGYQNVVPSLCTYFEKDRKALRLSLIIGLTIPLIFYLIWQWLMIGSIPKESMEVALKLGQPATFALQAIVGKSSIYLIGQFFAFFAIVTSLLGVAFSMVDFLADGLKIRREGVPRVFLSFLTFFPPFLLASYNPQIFEKALGIAGGFGEAVLNGLIPIGLVWVGRYIHRLDGEREVFGEKKMLSFLFFAGIFVVILEIINLF
ncbi:MAG: tyrosine transporter [Chlamydiae bacterium]|nr:tyrosine transporter [Chlamydiota bacterium]